MEFNAKKYIDLIDQVLDLDAESKRKTTWIVVRILNILMTIELAIFLAERFGYSISITTITFDNILLGFKNYDVIVGITCFVLAYFGGRVVSWFIPNAMSYTRYWSTWSINIPFKEKMNKNLEDPEEFGRWKVNFDRRYQEAKIYTERLSLLLLFGGNLFLTYYFIVQNNLPLLYSEIISVLLFFAMVILVLIYTIFKGDLIWSIAYNDYFENKKPFKTDDIRKIDRYALKALYWIVNIVSLAIMFSIFTSFPSK